MKNKFLLILGLLFTLSLQLIGQKKTNNVVLKKQNYSISIPRNKEFSVDTLFLDGKDYRVSIKGKYNSKILIVTLIKPDQTLLDLYSINTQRVILPQMSKIDSIHVIKKLGTIEGQGQEYFTSGKFTLSTGDETTILMKGILFLFEKDGNITIIEGKYFIDYPSFTKEIIHTIESIKCY